MTLHTMSFRAFCQATEDEGKVMRALQFASGAGMEDIQRTRCEGYHGNKILLLEVAISRSRMVREAFLRLTAEDRRELSGTLEGRIDDEGNFFFRLDKQEAYLGRAMLGETGEEHDVIAVHGKVKCYPKSRENALGTMRTFLLSLDS